ncbi:hypothetical protein Theam_0497 [Thermovibrio ammonificans HB-1]|jgi:hypothetical protein|uniref:Uncharacterized protein n=1 Tax=Thermovibrio ammonificans (strain DSM 15698 / JCM 12110 / HB-1) TaxID=648996 RepID=E8T5J4_THEA1|nr:hypothetical protein Theam_0497 [Thermovibrio ammonificans HB-1]
MENSLIKKLMFYGVFGIYILIVLITSFVIVTSH